MIYDITIIGAGIIGSMCADMLAKYNLSICVLEKENDSGLEQTMSSSAIVHSGIDPKPGTLKAELNVIGNQMMEEICDSLNVEYIQCGGYVCANNKEDLNKLKSLKEQGESRGIPCSIISGDELRVVEPGASDQIIYALSMPTTGIIYPIELTIACVERSILNGAVVKYNHHVLNINKVNNYFKIYTNKGSFQTKMIINCAGMHSDEIARMIDKDFQIELQAKCGEYLVTDNRRPVVSSILYPLPTSKGKGVLAVPTTHKNVLLGPTSNFQEDRDDDSTHIEQLNYIKENVAELITDVPNDIIKTYSGLRSFGNGGDFYIKLDGSVINCVAIDSPGIASSPAIAKRVVDLVGSQFKLSLKADYIEKREAYTNLKKLKEKQVQSLIDNNEQYGHIICRCEQVSEGEIRDAIRKQNGATDLSGIKFRIRPMLGMCQGSFCEAKVTRILAEELGVEMSQITRRGEETLIVKGGDNG